MSRIGRKPVAIPAGVEVKVNGNTVSVRGPKGAIERVVTGPVTVSVDKAANQVVVSRTVEDRTGRAMHGLWRALINGMVIGVVEGYTKVLDIIGIGFKAEVQGNTLKVNVGFAVPYELDIPKGLKVEAKKGSRAGVDAEVSVTGIDKELVGQFAASIRRIKKPDLYKGKGIRYRGEYVRRLAGKTFGSAAT
jgi:large subunit ribosomal protein L6